MSEDDMIVAREIYQGTWAKVYLWRKRDISEVNLHRNDTWGW